MSQSDVAAIITLSSDEEDESKGKQRKNTEMISKEDCKMDTGELTKKRPLPNAEAGLPSKKRVKLMTLPKGDKKIVENGSFKVDKDLLLKPGLVERERRPVIESSEEIFTMFIGQCLQRERSSPMQKIITKLKRRYEQMDTVYSESAEFKNLLIKKRESLTRSDKLLYAHINEVYEEMKRRKKGKQVDKPPPQTAAQEEKEDEEEEKDASTSNKAELNDSIEDKEKAKENEEKIRLIILSMRKCKKLVKKYDEAEVDWNDEGNSDYIKAQKYKERMIQLHNKLCELTGERKDANRSYLKPKRFKVTKIESVDQAINSFINKKLKNKSGHVRSANSLIFPDYVDILNCIKKCNDQENLAMSNEAMKSLAKSSFEDLGKALQKERQLDYFETLSMFWEEDHGDDPAKTTPEIREKLEENRKIGDANMKKMLDDHVVMQEEAKANGNNGEDDDKDDDKEEEDEEEEEEDEEEEEEEEEIDMEDEGLSKCSSDDDEKKKNDDKNNHNHETDVETIDDDNHSDIDKENEKSKVENEVKKTESEKKKPENEFKKVETTVSNLTRFIEKISVEKSEENSIDNVDSLIDSPESLAEPEEMIIDPPEIVDTLVSEKITKLPPKIVVDSCEITNKLEPEKIHDPDITKAPPTPDSTTPEPHNTLSEIEVIDDELKTNETPEIDETIRLPMLKLRSFAKQPEFWQNSQEVDEIKEDKTITKESEQQSIELVTLDDSVDDDNSIQELPQQLGVPKRLKSSSVMALSAVKPSAKIIPLSSAILKKQLHPNPLANRAIIKSKNKKNGTIKLLQKVPSSQVAGIRETLLQTVRPGTIIQMVRPATQVPRQVLKTQAPRLASSLQTPRAASSLQTPRAASSIQTPRLASSIQAIRSTTTTTTASPQILRTAPAIQSARPNMTKSLSTTGTSQTISPSVTRHLPPTAIRLASTPASNGAVGNYGYYTSPIKSFQARTLGTIPGPSSATSSTSPSSSLSRVAIRAHGNKINIIPINRANGTVPRRIIKNVNNNSTKS